GKTPLVIWLCNFLKEKNINCAILTRGYKSIQDPESKTQNYSDEPALLKKACGGAKVIVNPDRVQGAQRAINEFTAEVLVLDDGFQHRRLHRDLDILTIDATNPFGYGKILPAGLLREPLSGLKRPGTVVLTRCNQVGEDKLAETEQEIKSINSDVKIARSIHQPICAKSSNEQVINIEELKKKRVFAFCGIGNPESFLNTINQIQLDLVGSKTFNDHHFYTNEDLSEIYRLTSDSGADILLTTQKDWTKISLLETTTKGETIAYLQIEFKFLTGEGEFKQLIEKALEVKIP
ncbi:MAG: tetraacyldisaccharide 4'-kinase, partial [Planctomycetota bacterium]